MIMKALKIVVVMLVLCFAFSGVAVIANSVDDTKDQTETKTIAKIRKGNMIKPSNA